MLDAERGSHGAGVSSEEEQLEVVVDMSDVESVIDDMPHDKNDERYSLDNDRAPFPVSVNSTEALGGDFLVVQHEISKEEARKAAVAAAHQKEIKAARESALLLSEIQNLKKLHSSNGTEKMSTESGNSVERKVTPPPSPKAASHRPHTSPPDSRPQASL